MAIDISNHMSYLDPNNEMKKEKGTPTKCHFTALPKCSWNNTKNELTLGPGSLQICIVQPHIQTTTASDKQNLDMKVSDAIQKHHYVDATVQDVLIRRFVLFLNSPNLCTFPAFNSTVSSIDTINLYSLHTFYLIELKYGLIFLISLLQVYGYSHGETQVRRRI